MTYASEVLADSPLIHWRLGEASGTTAADASGGGHTGTYTGSPTVGVTGLLVGDSDKAAQFHSASDDALASAATVGPTTLTRFSIEAVVKITANLVGGSVLFALCDPTGSDPGFIELDYNTTLTVFFQGSSGVHVAAHSFNFGQTYHVVGTFDGASLRLYLDGALVATTVAVDAGAPIAIPFCFIAGNFGGGGYATDGVVDECAFYGTALNGTRVAAHHAASIGAPPPPPPSGAAGCVAAVGGGFLADGATPDVDGILYTVSSLDGWWDTTAQRTGTQEQQPAGETVTAPRENARPITLEIVASNPLPGVPLGSVLCFTAVEKIKAAFAAVYVPVTLEVVDAVNDRTALVRRTGPTRTAILGQCAAVRVQVPLLATNPRLIDV